MRVMAFKGFDNVETFTVSKDGDDQWTLQSAGFTSARIIVGDTHVDGDISGNEVSAILGELDLPVGNYDAKLVAYSSVYPDGLVIAGPGLPEKLDVHVRE